MTVKSSTVILCLVALTACTPAVRLEGTSPTVAPTTSVAPLPRSIELTVDVEEDGATSSIPFDIPPGTRSVGITAVGRSTDVLAVTELVLGDGEDRIGVGRIPPLLLQNIAAQHVRLAPGDIFQEASIGVHSLVFPNMPFPGNVPAGAGSVRLSSTGRSIDLTIVFAPETPALTLALDVFVADPNLTLDDGSPALTRASDLLEQAGISVELRTIATVEAPVEVIRAAASQQVDGPVAWLTDRSAARGTDAVDVFIVPQLDVSGFSPRIPGPLVPHPLRAVVVKSTTRPSDLGRVIAHEIGHYLGLHHLELYTDDHRPIPDPLPDTEPGTNNLMDSGTLLTADQIEVIRRNPILEPSG